MAAGTGWIVFGGAGPVSWVWPADLLQVAGFHQNQAAFAAEGLVLAHVRAAQPAAGVIVAVLI